MLGNRQVGRALSLRPLARSVTGALGRAAWDTARRRRLLIGVAALAALVAGCASPDTLSPFHTDGCSRFPDRSLVKGKDWCGCCVEHDRAYWRGGTAEDRRTADEGLRACVQERTGDARLGALMKSGVRIGGSPYWPTRFRWGYGWGYGRFYRPLTAAESAEADQREAEFDAAGGPVQSTARRMLMQNRSPMGFE